uniref:translation initiation factor IF-2-like n=1 Tax=Nyctereutes procyonoides TaxID=34880 RepID=UPI0024451138|nr:translation initiation factor IF-2-like [Nyctereutes procyonoides]
MDFRHTRPKERRRGRSSSPEASRRGQRPLPRYLTPGLPCLRASSGVNFPPPEGGRTPRTPRTSPPSAAVTGGRRRARPAPFIRPQPLQPFAPPAGLPEATGLRAGAAGARPLKAAARPPSPETAMHHGRGVGAARRRETAPTPGGDPHERPHAHTPPHLNRGGGGGGGSRSAERQAAAGGPRSAPATPARRAGTDRRHTHRRPPCSRQPAAGHCGPPVGRRGPAGRQPAAPRGWPRAPAPLGSVLT